MSTTCVSQPTSRCLVGVSRCNITPPNGIYHRLWGAAAHDKATGVHRPLTATVLALQGLAGQDEPTQYLIALDHCLFRPPEMAEVLNQTSLLSGIPEPQLIFNFSHTHSGGYLSRDRLHLPGGDLIPSYLECLPRTLAAACLSAGASLHPATLNYASTTCRMGQNRDYFDTARNEWICGYNPDQTTDQTVLVARISDDEHGILATVVNYACHPTTLAFENSLISPDYIGALREVVEQATRAPCAFLLSPCGDVGPEHGFVGDSKVADRNGRQVGYAALSALESLPPPGTDFHYAGAVLSGATLGIWEYRPLTSQRTAAAGVFRHRRMEVELPYLPAVPRAADVERELAELTQQEDAARAAGQDEQARELRAWAERKRRLLERVRPLPADELYPLEVWLWQLGDAFWVALEGEPYNWLQSRLRSQFPNHPIVISTVANGARACYLPTAEAYEKQLYQVEIALLAPGCLETIAEAIAAQIAAWLAEA